MSHVEQERRQNADADKYFNALFEAVPKVVYPGQSAFSDSDNDMLVATLGAGIVVTLYDQELNIGAICYVTLPREVLDIFPYFKDANDVMLAKAFLPLDEAIAQMKQHGAGKNRILVRLIGGADFCKDDPDSGTKNTVFVREYIARKGLGVLNEDIGGKFIRRLHFFPHTGRAVRMVLKRESDFEYVRQLEGDYHKNMT
jgi:chemotaxis protein CheD